MHFEKVATSLKWPVKDAVLKAYEQVPEAYRQKFRNSTKDDRQTYVEFIREKERLLISGVHHRR